MSKKLFSIAARVLMMVAGVACALSGGLLAADQFGWLPTQDQRIRNETMQIRFTEDLGDLFYSLPGQVRPPENPVLLSEHTVEWDDNGFRVPALKHNSYDEYPIVALGDSYTEAWMVETPWPDVVARELNTPVLNLAYRGYGPLEEEQTFKELGSENHEWVLVAFFEGNDLQNIRTTIIENENNEFPLLALARDALTVEKAIVLSEDGTYRYPLPIHLNGSTYQTGFYEFYLWFLNGNYEDYLASKNVRRLGEVLQSLDSESGDACIGLIYIPSKENLYFQYTEPDARHTILDTSTMFTILRGDGWLEVVKTGEAVDFETWMSRRTHQRDAVQEKVEELGYHFIDLTPIFEQQAAENPPYYFTYDTHWNQAGHELAGQAVADYLRTVPACSP
ncbi:MAG: hypothetical protein K8I82_02250 [Anaerolineae bacterium]|nr:hypothetical protein [Anaerolineae bacterium]